MFVENLEGVSNFHLPIRYFILSISKCSSNCLYTCSSIEFLPVIKMEF